MKKFVYPPLAATTIAAIIFSASLLGSLSFGADEPPSLRAVKDNNGVSVWIGDQLFTRYKINREQKYPYFYPVNGPQSGESVTTETSEPYPHHHSLFFGCDRVNGGNYWQDVNSRGQILSQRLKVIQYQGDKIVFEDECLWERPEAPSPFQDHRIVTITAPTPDMRIIDFQITLTALQDVVIEKTNHSLFSARMIPELSVRQGGTLINAQGDLSEEGTFGKNSPWCDYSGARGDATEGLAIFSSPKNPWNPPKWFTRDYGFFSPTPMYWPENDRHEFAKNEAFTLQYRVIVHAGDAKTADIQGLYKKWAAE